MPKAQTVIPGTDHDRHKDIDDAAEAYVEARDIRMQCSQAETDAKKKLRAAMDKHHLREYKALNTSPTLLISITVSEEVMKVKRLGDPDDGMTVTGGSKPDDGDGSDGSDEPN